MKIEIDISKDDFNSIKNEVMTVGEMYDTVKGRLYRSVINGHKIDEPDNNYMENPCIKCKMTLSEKSACCGCPERLEWEKQ